MDIFDYDTCVKESSIKAASPFTSHFHSIYLEVFDEIEQVPLNNNAEPSTYHLPEFVYLLNSRFMPYCFIWASFVLRNFNTNTTRWTNGSMESFIGTRKNKEKSFLKVSPASYALQTYPLAKGGCIDFHLRPHRKEKRKKEIVVEMVEEVATYDAVDNWSKKPAKSDLVRVGKKQKQIGYYQSKVTINAIEPVKNESVEQKGLIHFSNNFITNSNTSN